MFIDISDVDHNCGHVTEGRRTFPAALDGQEVLGVCLKVQAFVDIQDPYWGGWVEEKVMSIEAVRNIKAEG